ncbi:MAG TPA: TrkA family potassium uptake protein [Thermoclostridium caenicola]|uniref:Trk system potassium uptake protein TrkA n=1 Tax=Thermoclostridium caenicola TaxID=659425 RepID=A0A1M6AFT2_9FIRM|nr:TrkA family potassium uptake protein [Thermoclostridium caenicola]SHI35271.1 trk system potassium uptake protein TrkA [Thermoclostridium caenicola]HOK42103.1 TrkA family potassium uptake protein [Thermoclostridium caenicola]HOL84089.1 TrkA family potassium uptake protein [Thermoclostridium caenicola]HPO76142.1 TrkA family potassium uptake protein [Thermoclostridium caenicola]
MHIIIAGCGKVGSGLASKLSREGYDVAVIDSDESAFEKLDDDFSGLRVVGVPIDQDILKKAGIDQADALAAVTPDDNMNIMVSQVAKDLCGIPRVVARIYNPAREDIFHQFGLETICPTNLTVETIAAFLTGKPFETTCTIGSNTISFTIEDVDPDLVGSQIIDIRRKDDRFIFGILKDGRFTFAHPYTVVEKGSKLVIAGKVD